MSDRLARVLMVFLSCALLGVVCFNRLLSYGNEEYSSSSLG